MAKRQLLTSDVEENEANSTDGAARKTGTPFCARPIKICVRVVTGEVSPDDNRGDNNDPASLPYTPW
eukprot:CAMPEP_0175068378 /NCGR_PEP_ID=MMETSP0052_2-20121109/17639_1 /TAXON_ID=51329 ORGANISM="Polytomella parva, Strain SAG 63-3" /NCGR_SAMPLE_ID=MMETSP0052_2 /ASSEMBLY_ACC=CAM_ASM_000194 /LENGTH=66 /DNA_ID=CAMNT_0016335401 /DNA_START=688 /DNA_END=888 /DNA_ORIENTATION=+